MTMKAHTYYIIFGRPPIDGKLPLYPLAAPLGVETGYRTWNWVIGSPGQWVIWVISQRDTVPCLLDTGSGCVGDSAEEDGDEPLERVLVHRVDVGQVGHAEEEDLSVDGDWDVLTARRVDVAFRLLGDLHLRLTTQQTTSGDSVLPSGESCSKRSRPHSSKPVTVPPRPQVATEH